MRGRREWGRGEGGVTGGGGGKLGRASGRVGGGRSVG